jgi:hypothetical protein
LVNDPEDGKLHLLGQTFKALGDVEVGADLAALGESVDIPTKRRGKSSFVEQRGMQEVGNRTNLAY